MPFSRTLLDRARVAWRVLTDRSGSRWLPTCSCGCNRVPCPWCGTDMRCEECAAEDRRLAEDE